MFRIHKLEAFNIQNGEAIFISYIEAIHCTSEKNLIKRNRQKPWGGTTISFSKWWMRKQVTAKEQKHTEPPFSMIPNVTMDTSIWWME